MSRLTASRKELRKPLLFWARFASEVGPQDLTLHSDVVHPAELAGICPHLNSGITGKKRGICASPEPRRALRLHLSQWALLLARAMCTRAVWEEPKSIAGGQSSRLVGNDYRGSDPEMRGTNSAGQLRSPSSRALLRHDHSRHVYTVGLPQNGRWKAERLNCNRAQARTVKTEASLNAVELVISGASQEVINLHVCGQLHELFLVMGPCVRKGLQGFNNDLQLTWLPTQQWLSERPTAATNWRRALLPEVLNYENI